MKPIHKQEFKNKTNALPKSIKWDMALELLPRALSKADSANIDARITNEIKKIKTKMQTRSSKRLSWHDLYKLYIVSDFEADEINHWVMRGNEIYRKKEIKWIPSVRRRRPSIYDPYGNVIPRTFIDKHMPGWVKTQEDYNHYMSKRRG